MDPLDGVSENFSDLQRALKSSEEIEAYSVDENISELDRAKLYGSSGTSIQKACLAASLPQLYKTYRAEIESDVLPRLLMNVASQDNDVQVSLAKSLETLLTSNALPAAFVSARLLKVVIEGLRQRDETVSNAWLGALFACFPFLPKSALQGEVLDLANNKCELTETVASRVIACKLYGRLAGALEPRVVESSFFAKAMALCQDTDYEVRIEMSRQLPALARAIGAEHTARLLLPELLELLSDEEIAVRLAGFEALAGLLDILDQQALRETVIPLTKRLLRGTPDDMIKVVAQLFGQLVLRIWPLLDEDDEAPLFIDFFKALAERPEPESRRLCAYNFPAVLKAMGPRKYALHLHPVLTTLAEDAHVAVRKCIAAGLHEVATQLGRDRAVKYVKDTAVRLLRDESREVQEALLAHLDALLSALAVPAPDIKLATSMNGWRKQLLLLEQWSNLAQYVTGDQLNDQVIPLLFSWMNTGAVPVKQQASRLLCAFLRKLKYRYQREDICQRLITDFARGQSFWHRMLFVETCQHLLDVFSRTFFKTNFFFIALELAKDRVPNVRMKLCELLPLLKRVLKLPKDNTALERLGRLAAIEVRMEGVSRDDADDAEDRRREEEERAMIAAEEAEPKRPGQKLGSDRRLSATPGAAGRGQPGPGAPAGVAGGAMRRPVAGGGAAAGAASPASGSGPAGTRAPASGGVSGSVMAAGGGAVAQPPAGAGSVAGAPGGRPGAGTAGLGASGAGSGTGVVSGGSGRAGGAVASGAAPSMSAGAAAGSRSFGGSTTAVSSAPGSAGGGTGVSRVTPTAVGGITRPGASGSIGSGTAGGQSPTVVSGALRPPAVAGTGSGSTSLVAGTAGAPGTGPTGGRNPGSGTGGASAGAVGSRAPAGSGTGQASAGTAAAVSGTGGTVAGVSRTTPPAGMGVRGGGASAPVRPVAGSVSKR